MAVFSALVAGRAAFLPALRTSLLVAALLALATATASLLLKPATQIHPNKESRS